MNTKFPPQWNAPKSSHQVTKVLAYFRNLITFLQVKAVLNRLELLKFSNNYVGNGLERVKSKNISPETSTQTISETNSSFHEK